jgi:hypothetical protein
MKQVKLLWLALAMTFIAVGCAKKPTKSLHQAATGGSLKHSLGMASLRIKNMRSFKGDKNETGKIIIVGFGNDVYCSGLSRERG